MYTNPAKDIYVGVMKTCKRVFGSSIKLSFKLSILKWGVNEYHHDYQKIFISNMFISICAHGLAISVSINIREVLYCKIIRKNRISYCSSTFETFFEQNL